MEKTINVTKAREELRTIVDDVQFRGDKYVISRHGKPAVAVVPIQIYDNWKSERQKLIKLIDKIRRGYRDIDPEEVMQDVLETQQAVDESDNRYIECAVAGEARYIVSGDNHLLDVGEYKGSRIVTPASYLTLLDVPM